MNYQVWKFPIEFNYTYEAKIEMPAGAKILTLQVQRGTPCIWAQVDPDNAIETRTFSAVGTGWEFSQAGNYVGTYFVDGGNYVFHVFEIT